MFSLTHRESGIKLAMKEVKMEPQYSKMPEVSHFTKITILNYYEVLYLAAKMSPLKIAVTYSGLSNWKIYCPLELTSNFKGIF